MFSNYHILNLILTSITALQLPHRTSITAPHFNYCASSTALQLLHFNYCAETWNFCSKGATTKLEKLNERALRFVYRDHSSSYEMLLKQSGYQTLLNQRLAKILTTVYKVVNRQCVSESLHDLVEIRKSNYNLRGDKILTLPKVNTTKYGLKSLRYEGANLWNKLPNEYRKADSYKLFKKQILDTDLAGRYMS